MAGTHLRGGLAHAGPGMKASGPGANPSCFHTGQIGANVATMGTDTTPVITETYICELFVPVNMLLTGLSLLNGSAVAGNITLGLADCNGVLLANTASTAASGTAGFQQVPLTAPIPIVGPAKYFVLLQNSSASNRYRAHAVGNFGASKKTGEVYGTLTTITAPTTFTASQGPVVSTY